MCHVIFTHLNEQPLLFAVGVAGRGGRFGRERAAAPRSPQPRAQRVKDERSRDAARGELCRRLDHEQCGARDVEREPRERARAAGARRGQAS